jgi:hypothetical protein
MQNLALSQVVSFHGTLKVTPQQAALCLSQIQLPWPRTLKLVLQHDTTRPLGKLMSGNKMLTGITAEFRIAKTTAGNDALEEAATGLRSDFSVGVDVTSMG